MFRNVSRRTLESCFFFRNNYRLKKINFKTTTFVFTRKQLYQKHFEKNWSLYTLIAVRWHSITLQLFQLFNWKSWAVLVLVALTLAPRSIAMVQYTSECLWSRWWLTPLATAVVHNGPARRQWLNRSLRYLHFLHLYRPSQKLSRSLLDFLFWIFSGSKIFKC